MEKLRINPVVESVSPGQLAQLVTDTGLDAVVIDRWSDMIDKDLLMVLAVCSGGKYLGRANLWLAEADEEAVRTHFPGVPLVNALQVNESARNMGVGTMLMQGLEVEAARRGFASIGLGVEPDNQKAIDLYTKIGYEFQMLGEDSTYTTGWWSTSNDGSKSWHEVPARFMMKNLNSFPKA